MSNIFSVSKAAKFLDKTVKTLQRWDREGTLVSTRSPTNRRHYTEEQLLKFIGQTRTQQPRSAVAYCRVSSQNQKPDLINQRSVIETFCLAKGLANVEYLTEISGGLNFKRPIFTNLIDRIEAGLVSHLIIAHKDRLTRFGFDWFEHVCQKHNCELLILNQEKLSPEAEMVQDLMTIIHCFSSRLYGLRNYKKSLKEALNVTSPEVDGN